MSASMGQRIEKWGVVDGLRIAGTVYDRPGQADGGLIVTSPVVEIRFMGGGGSLGTYPVAFTESGSAYRLGGPAPSFGLGNAEAFIQSRLTGPGATVPCEPNRTSPDFESSAVPAARAAAPRHFERIELYESSFKPMPM